MRLTFLVLFGTEEEAAGGFELEMLCRLEENCHLTARFDMFDPASVLDA